MYMRAVAIILCVKFEKPYSNTVIVDSEHIHFMCIVSNLPYKTESVTFVQSKEAVMTDTESDRERRDSERESCLFGRALEILDYCGLENGAPLEAAKKTVSARLRKKTGKFVD